MTSPEGASRPLVSENPWYGPSYNRSAVRLESERFHDFIEQAGAQPTTAT